MPDDTASVGELIAERYRVERELGRGGSSHVYLALDERLGRRVALKIVAGHGMTDADVERARQEALVAASLDDPRLVTVHDAIVDETPVGERTIIVMRYIEGRDLSSMIALGALDAATVATVGADIAAALEIVHSAGIVHRDVKPGNVLVTDTPAHAVLVDFGIARADDTPPLTVTGTVIGTPAYLSPEQVTGGEVSPASDVYALGLVLLEALTGRREFEGPDVESAIARISRDPVVPPALGTAWSELIGSMTARDPLERPTASAVASRLGDIAESVPDVDAPTVATPTPTRVISPTLAASFAAPATATTESLASVARDGGASTPSAPRARSQRIVVGAIAAATVLIASGLVAIGVSLASNTPDEADGGSTRTPSPVATTVADQSTPSPTATAPVAPAPAPPPAKPGPGKPDKPDKPGKKG